MSGDVPTLEEFKKTCREEFAFLVQSHGFHEATPRQSSGQFCVRFEKGDWGLEVRGEGYGTQASCQITRADAGALDLVHLVPLGEWPRRSAKRDRMGQLDRIRELAQIARAHANDVFAGDGSRFEAAWSERNRTRKPGGAPG